MEGGDPMEVEKNGVFSYSSSNFILDRQKQTQGLKKENTSTVKVFSTTNI